MSLTHPTPPSFTTLGNAARRVNARLDLIRRLVAFRETLQGPDRSLVADTLDALSADLEPGR